MPQICGDRKSKELVYKQWVKQFQSLLNLLGFQGILFEILLLHA